MGWSALVVDDDELVRIVLSAQLRGLHADRVVVACDGDAAAKAVRDEGPFDVILLDLLMPEADGITFLRTLADAHAAADLILMSSLDRKVLETAESLARAHRLSVLGILAKPTTPDQLRRLLDQRRPRARGGEAMRTIGPERLAAALRDGRIVPFFQPKICARTGQVLSAEALARWDDPVDGLILPGEFIAVAEQHGMINELTRVIGSEAFRCLSQWRRQGFDPTLEINLSALSLNFTETPDAMRSLAAEHGIEPSRITFEITESALIDNPSLSLDTLTRLRLMGFHIAVDDFGIGYSTFKQLKMLPLAELKIDIAFVSRALVDPEARAIVESCVDLAKRFGLITVAEGVEDAATAEFLSGLGTTMLQGHLYTPALRADALYDWWRTRNGA